jgi:hypothetical protein
MCPMCPPILQYQKRQAEAMKLYESVEGDPTLLTLEQKAAIWKFWP